MAFLGGDIREVTYNHPTLGSGTVYCKAAEDSTINRGGYMKNDDAQGVSGDGQVIYSMNRKRWRIEVGPVLWDMTERDELDRLQQIQNHPTEADWTISNVNGSVFGGTGTPVGDLTATTNNPFITLILAGGGTLDKIA